MNPKSMLRRTLALLLVLIFALSNMGLAEMAEQIAAEIPAAEAPVEEVAEAAEESASENSDDGGVDAAAAPEGVPEGDAPAEDEAPAEAGVEVSVELIATDETTLTAFETITPEGEHDISYMWEIAPSEEGPWTVMDETGGWIVSEAEDRADYVYRCTVTADGVSATSAPATFDWGVADDADEGAAETAALDLEELSAGPSGTASITAESQQDVIIYDSTAKGSITLTAALAPDMDLDHFVWYVKNNGATDYEPLESNDRVSVDYSGSTGSKNEKAKLTIKSTAASSLKNDGTTTIDVMCKAANASGELGSESQPATITLLPAFDSALKQQLSVSFIKADGGDLVTELKQPASTTNATAKAVLSNGISEKYGVTWAVAEGTSFEPAVDNKQDWITSVGTDGTITVAGHSASNDFTAANKDGQIVSITATVGPDTASQATITGKIPVRPAADSVDVLVNGKAVDATNGYPGFVDITLTADAKPASGVADGVGDVTCFGEGEITWDVKDGDSGTVTRKSGTGATFVFTPGNTTASYTATATCDGQSNTPTSISIKAIGEKFEAANGKTDFTFIQGDTKDQSLAIDNAGSTYSMVEWKIDQDSNGWGIPKTREYIAPKDAESITFEQDGSISGANTATLAIKLHDDASAADLIETPADKPVKFTATGYKLNAAKTGAEKVEIEFTVNVKKAGTGQPADNKLTITPKNADFTQVGQPGSTTTVSPTYPVWATAQAALDTTGFGGYQVKWGIGIGDTVKPGDTCDWATIDENGLIKVTQSGSNNTTFTATGTELVVAAAVLNKIGEDGSATYEGTPAKAKFVVLPESVDGVKFRVKKSTTEFEAAADDAPTHSSEAAPAYSDATLDDEYHITLPKTESGKSANIEMKLAPVGSTPAYGKIEKLTLQKGVDGATTETTDPVEQSLPNSEGIVSFPTGETGEWRYIATTTTGKAYALYITVVDVPDSLELKADRQVMYMKTTGGEDALALTVDAKITGSTQTPNTDGLVWTLGGASGSSIDNILQIEPNVVSSASNGKISMTYTTSNTDKTHVTLHVPQGFAPKNTGTPKFTVTVRDSGSGAQAQMEITLKSEPALPQGVADLSSSLDFGDVFIGTSGLLIAQGESFSVKLKNPVVSGETKDVLTALDGYDLKFTVTQSASTDPTDWIEVTMDQPVNGARKSATIHAFASGEKKADGTTARNNVFTDTNGDNGEAFTLNVVVPGTSISGTKTITVVSAPKDIIFTNDDRNTTTPNLPVSLALGNTNSPIKISAVLVGQESKTTQGKTYKTLEDLPALSQETANQSIALLERAVKAAPDSGNEDYWNLTAKAKGTAKITATSHGVTKTYELEITQQQGIVPDPETATVCPGKDTNNDGQKDQNVNGQHDWVLADAINDKDYTSASHAPNAEGHIYVCKYCGQPSKRIKHADHKLTTTKKKADGSEYTQAELAEMLVMGDSSVQAVCGICGFACTHANYDRANATFVDTTYHSAQCTDCGFTIKEKHTAQTNGTCQYCGRAALKVSLTNAADAYAVVDGEAFTPKLKVEGTSYWTATYAAKGSDSTYIDVDSATGKVTARGVKTGGGTATVVASVTSTANGTTSDPVPFEFQVNLRTKAESFTWTASQTDSSGKPYIIGGQSIKLTVTPGSASNDLRGYKWVIDPAVTGLSLHGTTKDTNGKEIPSTATASATVLNGTEIWITADAETAETKLDAVIKYAKAGDATAKAVEIKFDSLEGLGLTIAGGQDGTAAKPGTSTKLSTANAIVFDDKEPAAPAGSSPYYKIIDGGSIAVGMKYGNAVDGKTPVLDSRYGTVKFTVEPNASETDITIQPADVKYWLTVTSTGNTINSVAGMLAKNNKTDVDFTVVATLTTDVNGKTEYYRVTTPITLVAAPAGITLQYTKTLDKNTDPATAGWTDVPVEGLTVYEHEQIALKAVVPQDSQIDASDVKFDYSGMTGNATKVEKTAAQGSQAATYYADGRFEISKGAKDFTVSATAGTANASVQFKVKAVASKIDVTSSVAAAGVGEKQISSTGSSDPITIRITATPDAEDNVTFQAKDKSGKTVDLKWHAVEGVSNAVEFSIATEPDSTRAGSELTITATAERSGSIDEATGKYDATKKLTGKTVINLYREPDGANAFVLKTEKADVDGTLTLTAGASTVITEAGYNGQDGYGAMAGMDIVPQIRENKPTDTTKTECIRIGTKDGKPCIEAVEPGSAKIAVWGYNSVYNDTQATGPIKELQITVTGKVNDEIEIDEAEIEKTHEVAVGTGSSASLTIPKMSGSVNTFKVYRDTVTGPVLVSDTEYDLELQPIDSKLTVTEIADGWELHGVTAGESGVKAVLGTAQSAVIPVTVIAKPEAIRFKDATGKIYNSGDQYQLKEGDTEPIEMEAITQPTETFGTLVVDPTTGPSATVAITGTKFTVTPTGETGVTTVTAKIENTDWSGNADLPNDPQYIYGHIDFILTGDDAPIEEPNVQAVKIVGKDTIGVGETTTVVAVGNETNPAVTWSIDATRSTGSVSFNPTTGGEATVTGVTAGKVTIQAKDGAALIDEVEIEVLSALSVKNQNLVLAANQTISNFYPEFEGYAGTLGSADYYDMKGLFTYSIDANASKYLTLATNEDGYSCSIVGKKATNAKSNCTITVKPFNSSAITINVTVTPKNTGFTLGGFEGTTQYMGNTDKLVVPVTCKPKKATLHLTASIWSADGDEDAMKFDYLTNTLSTEDAPEGTYEVTLIPDGYAEREPLSFNVKVVGDAKDASDTLSIAIDKAGAFANAYETAPVSSVDVVVGEILQAKLIDASGKEYAGATWTQDATKVSKQKLTQIGDGSTFKAKKVGDAVITATAGSNRYTFNVHVAKAPAKPKMKLDPTATTRTVAIGEPFELKLTGEYGGTASKWQTVEWSGDAVIYNKISIDYDETAGTYTFVNEGDYADETFYATATMKTSWGYTSKPVKFTIPNQFAETVTLSDIDLPVTGTTIVKPEELSDGAYANLIWTAGSNTLDKINKNYKIDKTKVQVKLLDNGTLQITTKKADANFNFPITVKLASDKTGEPVTATATVKASSAAIAEGAVIALDKEVIGVGEKINVTLDESEAAEHTIGNVTFKAVKASGKGSATVKGNVLTGKGVGSVTVKAFLDGKEQTNVAPVTLYIVPKATVSYSQKPTKMAVGEIALIGVTIGGYDQDPKATLTEEYKAKVDTSNLLSVTSKDNEMVRLVGIVPDEDAAVEGENAPHRYFVMLEAVQAKRNAKGAFTSTNVTIIPQMGSRQTMKITVTDSINDDVIWFNEELYPSDVYIGLGETITMPAIQYPGSTTNVNIDWKFATAEDATKGLSFTKKGQLKADRKATAGAEVNLIGRVDLYNVDNAYTIETTVHIGQKVTNASQFDLVLPKTSMGVTEPVKAMVSFENHVPYGSGKVTWKSTKTAVATVNKNTGEITGKKAGKSTVIRATVNGKKKDAKLNIVEDPTSVSFTANGQPISELKVVPTGSYELWDNVSLSNGAKADPAYKKYETAFNFWAWYNDAEDDAQGILADVDPFTGALTFNPNVTEGTAHVRVSTYNGLVDDLLIVMGNGGSGTGTGGEPSQERVPAQVELWMGEISLAQNTATNPIQLTDEDGNSLTMKAIVKDSQGVAFVPKAGITWGPATSEFVRVTPVEGSMAATLTALKSTKNVTNTHEPVQITVTAGEAKASFYVQIDAVMRRDNVDLYVNPSALLVNDQATAMLVPAVNGLTLPANLRIEAESTTKDIITISDSNPNDLTFNVTALTKTGAGNVHVKVYDSNGTNGTTDDKLLFEFDKEIGVNPLPASSQIKIMAGGVEVTDANPLVLAQTETGDFEIEIADFTGTPAAADIKVEFHPYKTDGTVDTTQTETTLTTAPTSTSGTTTSELKRTITQSSTNIGKYQAVVSTYQNDRTDKTEGQVTFTVEIKKKAETGQIKVDATPKADAATKTVTIGVNEIATLNASVDTAVTEEVPEPGIWNKGAKWTFDSAQLASAGSADAKTLYDNGKLTVVITDDTQVTVQLTETPSDKKSITVPLKVGLKDADPAVEVTYNVVIKPQPTTQTTGAVIDLDTPLEKSGDTYTIGASEKVVATLNMSGSNAYSNNVSWQIVNSSTNVRLGASSNDSMSTEIIGVTPTNEGGTVTVNALAGTPQVVVASIQFKVVAAPERADIALKENGTGSGPATNYVPTYALGGNQANIKHLTVGFTADTSATFKLESGNDHIKVEAETGKKNAWKLSWNQDGKDLIVVGTDTVSLTLSCPALSFSRNYNLQVSDIPGGIKLNGVDGVTGEVGTETPGKDLNPSSSDEVKTHVPNGFGSEEGGRTGGPADLTDYVDNQKAVTESTSTDGNHITITLSADVTQMNQWKSSEQDVTHEHPWYLTVIDTGIPVENVAAADSMESGKWFIANTFSKNPPTATCKTKDMGGVNEQADRDKADKFAGNSSTNARFIVWLQMDDPALLGDGVDMYLWKKEASKDAWETEPYMTITFKLAA